MVAMCLAVPAGFLQCPTMRSKKPRLARQPPRSLVEQYHACEGSVAPSPGTAARKDGQGTPAQYQMNGRYGDKLLRVGSDDQLRYVPHRCTASIADERRSRQSSQLRRTSCRSGLRAHVRRDLDNNGTSSTQSCYMHNETVTTHLGVPWPPRTQQSGGD